MIHKLTAAESHGPLTSPSFPPPHTHTHHIPCFYLNSFWSHCCRMVLHIYCQVCILQPVYVKFLLVSFDGCTYTQSNNLFICSVFTLLFCSCNPHAFKDFMGGGEGDQQVILWLVAFWQMLPDTDGSSSSQVWRRPGWTCWYWKDRNNKGVLW